MSQVALELAITHEAEGRYSARATILILNPTQRVPLVAHPAPLELDLIALRALETDPEGYSKALTAMVFVPQLVRALGFVHGYQQRDGGPAALRLALDPGDDQLHSYLEQEDEPYRPVPGQKLVESIAQQKRPMMVILLACNSAGSAYETLTAVGPQLAQTGVPAVLAMHGQVPAALVADFVPRFLEELSRDGRVDRAVAAAPCPRQPSRRLDAGAVDQLRRPRYRQSRLHTKAGWYDNRLESRPQCAYPARHSRVAPNGATPQATGHTADRATGRSCRSGEGAC